MKGRVFAVCAHPDDIEFEAAGTLLRLKDLGYEIHCMTVADGSLGGNFMSHDELAAKRAEEARNACATIGAIYHGAIASDLEVYYNAATLDKMIPIMREVNPEILLTHGLYDYMEDHINAGRLAVSAAFARGMGNYPRVNAKITMDDVAVYHTLPMSLKDQFNRPIQPDYFVDITSKLEEKKKMLACHETQKRWLDESQGLDAYLDDMANFAAHMGKMSVRFQYAEGFVRHNPIGFCAEDFDPLMQVAVKA
ncbi:MAG: PIG-L family deacetylase [Victivallaceae bacterium]|nr:PIG-L family deacetylase [Victivallaceae bacterium]